MLYYFELNSFFISPLYERLLHNRAILSAMVSTLASTISSVEGNSERVNSDTTEYKSPKTLYIQERPGPE